MKNRLRIVLSAHRADSPRGTAVRHTGVLRADWNVPTTTAVAIEQRQAFWYNLQGLRLRLGPGLLSFINAVRGRPTR